MKFIASLVSIIALFGLSHCEETVASQAIITNVSSNEVKGLAKASAKVETISSPEDSKKATELILALYETILKTKDEILEDQAFSADTLKKFSKLFTDLYVLVPFLNLGEDHILKDSKIHIMLAYLAEVAVTNLLPYYATQPFCFETKNYYEPVSREFYDRAHKKYLEIAKEFVNSLPVSNISVSEETQKVIMNGLADTFKKLFGYVKEQDIKEVAPRVANDMKLEQVVVERFIFFFPINLFATAGVLGNILSPNVMAETICTHLGYASFVDNQMETDLRGHKFWNHIRAISTYSGVAIASSSLAILLGLSTFALSLQF